MSVIDYVVTDPEKNPAQVHVDLDKKLAKDAAGYKPGQQVKLVIIGKLSALNLHKPGDPDEAGFIGSLTVKATKIALQTHSSNAFEELLEND